MTIRHKCEGCGSTLKIKDELAGKPGKCPKCKAKFIVGQSLSDDSDDMLLPTDDSADSAPASSKTAAPVSDEDDMFGQDFFKLQQPSSRPMFTMPALDEDEHEIPDEGEKKPAAPAKGKGKPATPPPPTAPSPSTADSAAAMASQLLAKTGKKNKSADQEALDAKAEKDAQKLDLTEAKYMLTHKILPFGGGAIVLVGLLYWMFSSMLSEGSNIPPLGKVSGVVQVQGKPAASVEVRFEPQPPAPGEPVRGSFSVGWTDASGAYQLQYNPENMGAAVGKHKVTVTFNGLPLIKDVEVKAGTNDIPLSF